MLIVVQMVLVMLIAGACAKRPNSAGTSAPAPSGVAGTGPGAGQAGAGGTGAAAAGGGASGSGAGGEARLTAVGPNAPVVPRPEVREFRVVDDLQDVFFEFDRYDIRSGDAKVLDKNARWLRDNAGYLLLIEGHADERGTDAYNVVLGERRAKATMNYLLAQGVQATRINIVSYGEERPTCRDRTEGCWAKNRRAHFLVKPR
jgi:peptidoglycan-associated lipoprotein